MRIELDLPRAVQLELRKAELEQRLARLLAWARTREGTLFLGMLALALLVRLALSPLLLFPNDPQFDMTWGREFLSHPLNFYSYTSGVFPHADYPPLSIYVFALIYGVSAIIAHVTDTGPVALVTQSHLLTVAIKMPPIMGDLGLTSLFYYLARRLVPQPWALTAAATYAFSPYVLIIGALWGQQDAAYVLAIVLALVLAFQGREVPAGVASAAAILLKPQPLVLLPIMVVYLWRWFGRRAAMRFGIALAGTGAVLSLPFLLPPHPEVMAYLHNVSVGDPAISARGALNFWWLVASAMQYQRGVVVGHDIGLWVGTISATGPFIGPLSMATIAWLFVAAAMAWVSLGYWRTRSARGYFGGASLVASAFYLFGTQQAVRYFLPAFVLLLIAALYDRRFAALYVTAGAVITLNTVMYLLWLSPSTQKLGWVSPFYQWLATNHWLPPLLAYVMLGVFAAALVLGVAGGNQSAGLAALPARQVEGGDEQRAADRRGVGIAEASFDKEH